MFCGDLWVFCFFFVVFGGLFGVFVDAFGGCWRFLEVFGSFWKFLDVFGVGVGF